MSGRITGIIYRSRHIFIRHAVYFSTHLGVGLTSWNADLFQAMLSYVDLVLTTTSLIALVIGIIYLA
ncbi:MAG: hypothetical protein PVG32_17840 [Anaerolineales bacterium]|jgi:hypothetical protein